MAMGRVPEGTGMMVLMDVGLQNSGGGGGGNDDDDNQG